MNTILITGANGQLGNEIRALSSQFSIFNFLFTDYEELDIRNYDAVESFFLNQTIDYIVNCAAYTNVDKAETDYENALNINSNAVKHLASVSKKRNIPLIHISTDYVFDGNQDFPYKETDRVNPSSAYGKTKLLGEIEASKAYKCIIIRTSWLYSSFGHNFVKTMIRLGSEKNEINVVSDQTGSPTYAKDLAEGILNILIKSTSDSYGFKEGIYHFSNEGSCSWYEFALEIMKNKNLNCKVNPIQTIDYPTPAKRPKYSLLDKTKFKTSFNFEIRNWKEAFLDCLNKIN
jgi:dTDP-4-dehydrorhamnose reductase